MKNLSIKDLKEAINLGWLNIDGVDNQDELRARLAALELELRSRERTPAYIIPESRAVIAERKRAFKQNWK